VGHAGFGGEEHAQEAVGVGVLSGVAGRGRLNAALEGAHHDKATLGGHGLAVELRRAHGTQGDIVAHHGVA